MELRHMRYFLAVAEEMNFTKAAEKLCIAQPPLSRQIQDLENELDTKLFIRKPHALQLTEAGALFRQYCTRVLELVEKSAEDIKEMDNGLSGTLYISSVEGHAPSMIAGWIHGFQQQYRGVQYNIWNGNSDDVIFRVKKGLCDLAVIMEPYNPEGLGYIPLYKEPWVAMMPSDHPLAKEKGNSISLEKLAPYDLIIPSRHSRMREVQEWFSQSGIEPKVRCYVAHTLNAFELTQKGVGIAIYPASASDIISKESICIKNLKDPAVTASYVLVWNKDRPLSNASKEFLQYIREQL